MADHYNLYEMKQFARTVADCMDFPLPEDYALGITWASETLKARLGGAADRAVLYHADAVPMYVWQKYTDLFAPVYKHTSMSLPFLSTVESVTPVAHASMYTGVDPVVHGIMTYTRPQLTCDTLYDQLVAAGKKVAILAMPDSTFLHIFAGRDKVDYFCEETPEDIQNKALELIAQDIYDVISIHTFEYDTQAHHHSPESPEALHAIEVEADGFQRIAKALEEFSGKHRILLTYSPDHGQHAYDMGGKMGGAHGSMMIEDMNVVHFFGTIK